MPTFGRLVVTELELNPAGGIKGQDRNNNHAVKPFFRKEDLADDAGFDLPNAAEGFATITDGTEYIHAFVASDGSVTGITTSTNASIGDVDTDLCLFDNGTAARVRNRLGSQATVRCIFWYI